MLDEVLKFIGLFGIGSATAAWLSVQLINHRLSKEIELFKDKIKRDADVALERLRADARVDAFIREKKIALLAERRAKVLAKTHHLLCDLISSLGSVVMSCDEQSESYHDDVNTAQLAGIRLGRYFRPRKIFSLPIFAIG